MDGTERGGGDDVGDGGQDGLEEMKGGHKGSALGTSSNCAFGGRIGHHLFLSK